MDEQPRQDERIVGVPIRFSAPPFPLRTFQRALQAELAALLEQHGTHYDGIVRVEGNNAIIFVANQALEGKLKDEGMSGEQAIEIIRVAIGRALETEAPTFEWSGEDEGERSAAFQRSLIAYDLQGKMNALFERVGIERSAQYLQIPGPELFDGQVRVLRIYREDREDPFAQKYLEVKLLGDPKTGEVRIATFERGPHVTTAEGYREPSFDCTMRLVNDTYPHIGSIDCLQYELSGPATPARADEGRPELQGQTLEIRTMKGHVFYTSLNNLCSLDEANVGWVDEPNEDENVEL